MTVNPSKKTPNKALCCSYNTNHEVASYHCITSPMAMRAEEKHFTLKRVLLRVGCNEGLLDSNSRSLC